MPAIMLTEAANLLRQQVTMILAANEKDVANAHQNNQMMSLIA